MIIGKIKRAYSNLLTQINALRVEIEALRSETSDQKILSAKILSALQLRDTGAILENIQKAEYKVFSQWDDDGIIQFLVSYIQFPNQTFIEFGVEDYRESNTRFLLMKNNWSGLIMDGSASHIEKIKNEPLYWKYQLTAVNAFITAENINSLISAAGFEPEVGILHIDIDGNDYWVWKAIDCIDPVLVIMEYNSVFGKENPWTVPYAPDFYRTRAHHSNLFFGASLLSLCDLAEEKGYAFIGSNSHGNNAYFIKKKYIKSLKPLSAAEGYIASKFREGRTVNGTLSFVSGEERLRGLQGMEVFNTRILRPEKI